MHCIYPHTNTDEVQLESPAHDPDIDGLINLQQEPAIPKKVCSQPPTPTPELIDQKFYGPDPIPTSSLDTPSTAEFSPKTDTIDSSNTNQELDQDKEDWDNGQF